METFVIKSGDLGPKLVVALTDANGNPVNLTGATVQLVMRLTTSVDPQVEAAMAIEDAMGGIISYQWVLGDTDVVGEFDASYVVTFLNGIPQTFPGDGYDRVIVEASLTDGTAPVIPAVTDYCWPVDTGCCDTFDEYPSAVQVRAKALAGASLRMLTGYSVGGCDVTVRPCKRSCVGLDAGYWAGAAWYPYNWAGSWINSCGCISDCACFAIEQIELPMPVGPITSVKVDGAVVLASKYRVDNGRWLVRLDGQSWPACQDMTKADTQVGTFSVTYLNARPVDGLGAYAAGILACEFAKACSGKGCRLPSGVTEISRQGVTMTIPIGAFPSGLTGIREVDAYLMSVNPHQLKRPTTVWSPDLRGARVTTWP